MPEVSWPAMRWHSMSEATDLRRKSGSFEGGGGVFSMLLVWEDNRCA